MAYYSDEQTDRELARLERSITKEYTVAYKELKKKAAEYFEDFAVRDAQMKKALEDGTYPLPAGYSAEAYYKLWRQNQLGRGARWEKLRDNMAKCISEANKVAAAYINDTTPGIYSLNYNYEAYQIEGITGATFDIYNEQTVKQLIQGENHTEFRTVSINPVRDYAWNTKKINTALLSGIMQGKSINGLADGFMTVMQSNRTAAVRNARTAVTSAQNSGRVETYRKAAAMGIEIKKRWLATEDERTRDSHRELDGVTVELDEAFPNGLQYPGDPKGAPAEVYNCRCTMLSILPKYSADLHNTGNTVKSYERWLSEKKNGIIIPKSIGAKGKNYQVNLPDGTRVPFTEGTRITNIKTIAGAHRNRAIDEVDVLVYKYGGKAELWQKKKGIGFVDYQGESYKAEVHWYEEPTAGKHDFKVKMRNGDWFIED